MVQQWEEIVKKNKYCLELLRIGRCGDPWPHVSWNDTAHRRCGGAEKLSNWPKRVWKKFWCKVSQGKNFSVPYFISIASRQNLSGVNLMDTDFTISKV